MYIIVVGIGNTIRQDDGVGIWVAEELARQVKEDENWAAHVDFQVLHQLDITLCPRLAGREYLFVIDAQQGIFNEDVVVREIEPKEQVSSFSTHIGSVENLLFLTRNLYGKMPRGFLVAVRGENFGAGPELSSAARSSGEKAVEIVRKLISELI